MLMYEAYAWEAKGSLSQDKNTGSSKSLRVGNQARMGREDNQGSG